MNKSHVVYGFLLGCIAPIVVMLMFAAFLIDGNIAESLKALSLKGKLPTVLRIGLLANLVLFMFFVQKKELFARGIVIATLLVLIISLIV